MTTDFQQTAPPTAGGPFTGSLIGHAALQRLVDALMAIDPDVVPERAVATLTPVVADVVADPAWLPERFYSVPPDKAYAQYLLQAPVDHTWCIMAVVWSPRAWTPAHDHMVWAVSGQLAGRLVETPYRRVRADGRLIALEPLEASTAVPRSVSSVVPPRDIHQVTNPDDEPAVAIQVYGRDLATVWRHVYDLETGEVRDMRSSYDTPPG